MPPRRVYKRGGGQNADRNAVLDIDLVPTTKRGVQPIIDESELDELTIREHYDREYESVSATRLAEATDREPEMAAWLDDSISLDENTLRLEILRLEPRTDIAEIDSILGKLGTVKGLASLDARIRVLNVEQSDRYNQREASYACNTYAADFLLLHPDDPYLPLVWQNSRGAKVIAGGGRNWRKASSNTKVQIKSTIGYIDTVRTLAGLWWGPRRMPRLWRTPATRLWRQARDQAVCAGTSQS